MKKFVFLVVIFLLALGAGCKKKEAVVETPPPPPQLPKQSEQVLIKGFISLVSQLEPGEVITVQVDKEKFISNETEFRVSLFPLEFTDFAEERYLVKYLFPSVVTKFPTFQLEVLNLYEYFLHRQPDEKVWILKESPAGTPPFDNIPTLLVEASGNKFWVLDQNGDEIRKR
mgnify:CR=1 FL=1